MFILLNGLFVYNKKGSLGVEIVFLVFFSPRAIVSCHSMHTFWHHYNDIQKLEQNRLYPTPSQLLEYPSHPLLVFEISP